MMLREIWPIVEMEPIYNTAKIMGAPECSNVHIYIAFPYIKSATA